MSKNLLAAAAAAVASLSSPAVLAASGEYGMASSYFFRGLNIASPAVHGSLNWELGGGAHIGAKVLNDFATDTARGASEAFTRSEISGGILLDLGGLKLDLGGTYYLFLEEGEDGGTAESPNTIEVNANAKLGMVNVAVNFSPAYFGTDEGAFHVAGSAEIDLGSSLSLVPEVGYSGGKGAEAIELTFGGKGEAYLNYGVMLVQSLKDDVKLTLGVAATLIDDDDPGVFVAVSKGFRI